MDWCQSVDALETHPVIFAGIIKARLEVVSPFEALNPVMSNLFIRMALRWRNYGLKDFFKFETRYQTDKQSYQKAVYSIFKDDQDYTSWLEYFSEILAADALDIKEKVMLGERQTKTAVAQGLTDLTSRQEKIIQFLSNYGTLINRDFPALFPAVSEDSVLRDLKTLINRGVIVKVGSTKSSKYKLKS
jgi:Fic family protein